MIAASANRSKNPLRDEIRRRMKLAQKERNRLRGLKSAKTAANRKWEERSLLEKESGNATESNVPVQINDPKAPKAVIKESQESLLAWLRYEPKSDAKFPPTSALPGSP